jgi:hypothetical protein
MLTQSLKICSTSTTIPARFSSSDARKHFQSGRIDEKKYKQLLRDSNSNSSAKEDKPKGKTYSQEILREIKEIEPEFEKPGADEVELTKHYMRKTGELRQTQAKEKIEEKGLTDRFRKVERI